MVVSNENYEEMRNQRVQENKRRMEELHLPQLTKALKTLHSPKPHQMKRTQPRVIGTEIVEVRRSNRVSNLPPRVYKPDLVYKKLVAQNFATKSTRSPAMIKAVEVRSSLGTEHPSCIKVMKGQANFMRWMSFPPMFQRLYLPRNGSEMVIEDENGEIHHVKYICTKTIQLGAGWENFAVAHNLRYGDVLVFHLVKPYKLKVYIVREDDLQKANDLITRLNLEARTKQMTSETNTLSRTPKKTKRAKPLSSIQFEELEGFKDFRIMVKGMCIDSELPDDVRMSYFKLCTDRKEFLHDCLPENLYYKLVAGMIGETVNIAYEIKNCKLTTTKEELDEWDNSLKSFSQLGMKVGFLRDRIATLSSQLYVSENRLGFEWYMEAKTEHKHVEDEIKRFTEVLKKLEVSSRKTQDIIDDLKQKAGRYELMFKEEVPHTISQ